MSDFLNKTRLAADYYVLERILCDIAGDLQGCNRMGERTLSGKEIKEKLSVAMDVCKDIIRRENQELYSSDNKEEV